MTAVNWHDINCPGILKTRNDEEGVKDMNKETTLAHPQHDHDYGNQIAAIRNDLESLQTDIRKLRDEVAEGATERMKDFKEQATETLKEKSEALRERSEQLRETGEQRKEAIAIEMQQHPFASVLAATGAGLAIGALAMWAQNGVKS
ncbi:MAG: hypothetical protein ABJP02_09400 [Parasphingorhabdus sp.]|uniref:DUF883 family protein n=1 Tax=Parasphingorhabdus sp. TaxID=2709688 RepID=UPI0032972BFC